jgi:6-carboxyhexanoate--CoA ligase
MKNLLSIRMRASKALQKAPNGRQHISGAEGLYEAPDIHKVVKSYIERAINHPKGKPDKVIITIEDMKERPKAISALPVATIHCRTPREGKKALTALLQSTGISKRAVDIALGLIKKGVMRGAAIVAAETGKRLEPDRERGIRVSRLGISKQASRLLSAGLSRQGINTDTVKEALVLASKVISHKDILAELCISDDPDYTTGYVASKRFGYIRISHIKRKGSAEGGRAFFVREGADINAIMDYLEKAPVSISKISLCKGNVSINEILNSPHQ